MQLPFELFALIFSVTTALSVIGIWQKIPALMFIGGGILTFVAILTTGFIALGDTQTCTSAIATTTCDFEPYENDPWITIILGIFGMLWMVTGVLLWNEMGKIELGI